MKQIPLVLNHPIVITEYKDKSGNVSIHVYGELFTGSSPVAVGVMIGKHRNGLSFDKVQTVHPNRNVISGVTKENTLYLNENKKETDAWFQALGAQLPLLGGIKYGFIRTISHSGNGVKISVLTS